MDRDETAHPADAEPFRAGPERFQAGPERFQAGPEEVLGGRPTRRGPRWWYWLIPAAVAALVITVLSQRGKPAASPAARTPSASTPAPSNTAPVVTRFELSLLLDETGGWELFGRGPDSVVRLQIASNRIIQTPVPGLSTGGGVSFVVGTHELIARPFDFVPGYSVPDGESAGDLPAGLRDGGYALPGPDPDHVWWQRGSGSHAVMALIGLDGRLSGVSIPVPEGLSPFASSDGAGYLLFTDTANHAVYDAKPGSLHKITTDEVLAIGPTGWLTGKCDVHGRCTDAVVDRSTGARHELPDLTGYVDGLAGQISPDGATAALPDARTGSVRLLSLADGTDRPLQVSVDPRTGDGTIVWSPDSRWLFAADRYGDLAAVERRSAQIRHFGTVLPELSQVAVRVLPR